MKNYVLVHGAWGAGWEFDEVKQLLSADGSVVHTPDLPGHGQNKVEIPLVTMAAYVQHVVELINKIDDKVILVGHSLGGAVISQVAETVPSKIQSLVYVAAILPKNGDSALSLIETDPLGQLLPKLIFSDDQSYVTLSGETVEDLFLHDVSDQERVKNLIPEFFVKQAVEPFTVAIEVTDENFGTVPKFYIRATLDKVLSPELQDKMITHWPVKQVFTLNSGHFPLTSIAPQLANVIQQIA